MSEAQVQATAEVSQDQAPQSAPDVAAIQINVDKTVTPSKFTFRFKKDKLGNKRANVELPNVPVPSYDGIVQILQNGGKEVELLLDAMTDLQRSVIADWVGSDEGNDASKFDPSKFTWGAIANMPKEDRRTVTITPEQWEAFAKSYLAVMPGVSGKNADQLGNALEIYKKKLTIVKTNKNVVQKLKDQLALYIDNVPEKEAEEHLEIIDMLVRRADSYLAADDVAKLTENL